MITSTTISGNGIIGYLGRGAARRELECMVEIAAGRSTKAAAKQLGCSPSTVEKAVERAFFKFKVSSRAALVAEAFRRGLISFACAAPTSPDPHHRHNEDQHAGVLIA